MSALPKPSYDVLVSNIPGRRHAAGVFLDGVIDTMVQLHGERGAGVFAFVAPHWRAGTTHVVNLVAEELAQRFRCTVGVMPRATLKEGHQSFFERSAGVYVAASNAELQGMPDVALENVWINPGVKDFDFTLVDCPALLGGPQALRWTNSADGVFLVVTAGQTHVNQVQEAQRLLKDSASRLEGIILNRRSYAIPELLYKLL
jgi:hypothetical protein